MSRPSTSFLLKSRKDVDARHNGMCSGRRSRTRVPGMTSFAIKPHSIGMGFSGSIEAASARRSKIKLFTDPDPKRGLGARLRVDADGRLLGDDPRAVAGLP